jgi:phenylalanyl-tRNA synthetase alpha subunit
MSEELTTKMIKAYLKMRDKRSEIKKAFEEQDEAIKSKMEQLEAEFDKLVVDAGGTSISHPLGTIIRKKSERFWTADWESMYKFVLEKQVPDFFEKRLAQGPVKEYLEANPGVLPPGLQINAEYKITVQRKRGT